jgi:PHD/YefM family antitoxin component YafN of YafNO toxin-antitoxin module
MDTPTFKQDLEVEIKLSWRVGQVFGSLDRLCYNIHKTGGSMVEKTIAVTEIQKVQEILDDLGESLTPVVLTAEGKPVAVVQDYAAYQGMLEKLEQLRHEVFVAKSMQRISDFKPAQTKTVLLRELKEKGVDRVLAELNVSD